jgi:hypothetical protein
MRTVRTAIKQGGRTDRTGLRQTTKQVAYSNGIDPNAAWANSAANMANSLGTAASAAMGVGFTAKAASNVAASAAGAAGAIGASSLFSNPYAILGAVALGFLALMKKK